MGAAPGGGKDRSWDWYRAMEKKEGTEDARCSCNARGAGGSGACPHHADLVLVLLAKDGFLLGVDLLYQFLEPAGIRQGADLGGRKASRLT
jgi:hypothetical protein